MNNRPKILLINGSPHQFGCTYTALKVVAASLDKNGVDTDFFWIGNKPVAGCIACKSCVETHRCVQDDIVNSFLDIVDNYDGFVFGSPVYFASATGAFTAFLVPFIPVFTAPVASSENLPLALSVAVVPVVPLLSTNLINT